MMMLTELRMSDDDFNHTDVNPEFTMHMQGLYAYSFQRLSRLRTMCDSQCHGKEFLKTKFLFIERHECGLAPRSRDRLRTYPRSRLRSRFELPGQRLVLDMSRSRG